jgi:HEAT repeat protein
MVKPKQIPFSKIIEALLNTDVPFPPAFLHRFSDIEDVDLNRLKKIWKDVPAWRRQTLMEDLEELGDSDYVLSFESLGLFALQDEDPKVREIAIRSLWDYDSRIAMRHFMTMLETDPVTEVKAEAALALGKFIYLGEIEEIPEKIFNDIENLLLNKIKSNEAEIIRRRALEAMGFSSRKEVALLINNAFASENDDWKASALLAMGRSADDRWIPQIKSMLTSDNSTLRYEAARSAGELEGKACLPELVKLLDDDEDDVSAAALWSLSQIGGKGIQDILEKRLEDAQSEDEAEFIETALENLEFTDSTSLFSLLDYSAEGDELDDLDEDIFDYDEIDDED